jgi:hypothetical protein
LWKTCHETKAGDSVLLSTLIGLNIMLPLFDFPQVTHSHCLPAGLPSFSLQTTWIPTIGGWLVGLATFSLGLGCLRFLSTIQITTEISGLIFVQKIRLFVQTNE